MNSSKIGEWEADFKDNNFKTFNKSCNNIISEIRLKLSTLCSSFKESERGRCSSSFMGW